MVFSSMLWPEGEGDLLVPAGFQANSEPKDSCNGYCISISAAVSRGRLGPPDDGQRCFDAPVLC